MLHGHRRKRDRQMIREAKAMGLGPSGKRALPSREKAKTIMREGETRGRRLSPKQRGFFGLIAGGKRPTRLGRRRRGRKPRRRRRKRKT